MSDKQKTTQEESRNPFAAMMEKMMGQQGQGCGCKEMMSQMMSRQGTDCGCADMMAMCGGQAQDKEETTAETLRAA